MTDYISREEVRDWLRNDWDGLVSTVFFGIDNIPTADVVPMDYHERCMEIEIQKRMNMVEVVRCKDCRTIKCLHGCRCLNHTKEEDMNRYIDAMKLIEDIFKKIKEYNNRGEIYDGTDAILEIMGQPTADVRENVIGKWQHHLMPMVLKCSVCGELIPTKMHDWNYCPNCGADMRGQTHE